MAAVVRPSIESSGTPLGFKVRAERGFPAELGGDGWRIRALARALAGMQKEAVVYVGPFRTAWRMVSDEGPYLNGTDLAPFPLAFYTAGLASSYASAILRVARSMKSRIDALTLLQDNFYTMEGSALKGTMTGGALPVELAIDLKADAPPAAIHQVVEAGILGSPGDACARMRLPSTFAVALNGEPINIPRVKPSMAGMFRDPASAFERIEAAPPSEYAGNLIEKVRSAETVFGVEGGAGSSLQAEQKRMLHVRGILTLRADGLKEINAQLFKPLGSMFRFLSDDPQGHGGRNRAPCGLSLLSAGIAFCYLTQLGRFAHIVKLRMDDYRLVQDTVFHVPDPLTPHASATAEPVDTHVFISSPEPADDIGRMIAMGEQTCFLHANLRGVNEARVAIRLNGELIT